jgi:hypothetical protein
VKVGKNSHQVKSGGSFFVKRSKPLPFLRVSCLQDMRVDIGGLGRPECFHQRQLRDSITAELSMFRSFGLRV